VSESFKTGIVEALIFASPKPISSKEIAKFGEIDSPKEVERIVEHLNETYEKNHRSFRIKAIAGGFQFFTINSYAPYVSELFRDKNKFRLSRAMLEVLSVIAVKQPITKPVIDKIRGADSGGTVHSLLEAGLITVKGRQKSPGKPFIYGTTNEFLKTFGLESLGDIPNEEEIQQLFEEKAREEEITQKDEEVSGQEDVPSEIDEDSVEEPNPQFEEAPKEPDDDQT